MPITDLGSYVTTGNEFDAHWEDVNTDRIANALAELSFPDGYGRAELVIDVAAVDAANTNVIDLENAVGIQAGSRNNLRVQLRQRLMEFRGAVQYALKGTGYVSVLPATPHPDASEQNFLKALHDGESVWTRLNADTGQPNFTPPLVSTGDYTLAQFSADVLTLTNTYRAVNDAENDLRMAREARDRLLDPLRGRFVQYREAIEVAYGVQHSFFTSLPDVYPQPGHTPDGVTLNGGFDPATQSAPLSWGQSSDPLFQQYQLRMSPGASYNAGNATVVDSFADVNTLATTTTEGLETPGSTATYRLFVMLTTGNEAGSLNDVTITRP